MVARVLPLNKSEHLLSHLISPPLLSGLAPERVRNTSTPRFETLIPALVEQILLFSSLPVKNFSASFLLLDVRDISARSPRRIKTAVYYVDNGRKMRANLILKPRPPELRLSLHPNSAK